MKLRIPFLFLSLLAMTLATVPAMAQTVYSNGPINGNIYAWTVNFGFVVSDTFNVANSNTSISGASFGIWLFPGDTLTSAELSITSQENGGITYFDQIVNFTPSNCSNNMFGYDLCRETTTFNTLMLNSGTFWLNLQNASVPSGDPVYWDENFGGPGSHAWPVSLASENTVGTIPSESFTILGNGTSTYPAGAGGEASTSVPEPSSIVLFASGILGLAGMPRRKLF